MVVDGRIVRCQKIAGVLTRLPYVYEREVHHIALDDRQYVAAEMGAFLTAWLASLACPILNRPMLVTCRGLAGDPSPVHTDAHICA